MKKILLFIDNLGAGGAQRQLVGLAVMLKHKGYHVNVCYYQDVPFYAQMLDDEGVTHELIKGSNDHKRRIPIIARYFKKVSPDWVIAYQETPSLVACLAKILGGRFKLLVSERNTTQKIGKRERIRFFLYHWADAIVPNSYAQEDFMASHYPWMKTRLQTINNFVDLEKFYPVEKTRRDVPLIVVAASAWAPKNVLGFIEAVRMLKERGVKLRVEWYGLVDPKTEENKIYHSNCKKKIVDSGVSDVLSLLPKTLSIAEKYRDTDYFCLPSFYEGTPNVICEAMASGLPVICSNVCDNPRYVHEGENGFLFNPHKPEEMADIIDAALKLSDIDYKQYCKKSREIAEEMLSEESFIEKYINIIDAK